MNEHQLEFLTKFGSPKSHEGIDNHFNKIINKSTKLEAAFGHIEGMTHPMFSDKHIDRLHAKHGTDIGGGHLYSYSKNLKPRHIDKLLNDGDVNLVNLKSIASNEDAPLSDDHIHKLLDSPNTKMADKSHGSGSIAHRLLSNHKLNDDHLKKIKNLEGGNVLLASAHNVKNHESIGRLFGDDLSKSKDDEVTSKLAASNIPLKSDALDRLIEKHPTPSYHNTDRPDFHPHHIKKLLGGGDPTNYDNWRFIAKRDYNSDIDSKVFKPNEANIKKIPKHILQSHVAAFNGTDHGYKEQDATSIAKVGQDELDRREKESK
jgi:hypothetical protein